MKQSLRLVLSGLFLTALLNHSFAAAKIIDYPYWPGVVVVKVMPGYLPTFTGTSGERTGILSIDRFLDEINATKFELKFIDALPPTPGGVDITRFYNVYFPESLEVPAVCRDFLAVEGIELAEPWQIDYIDFRPNDPQRGNQYAMDLCQVDSAYEISTGNRSMPIAIVDTGVWLNHQDLAANIWVNPAEDLNGDGTISQAERNDQNDDDGNGRVNDFYGWDFIDQDNDPTDRDGHGTHCAGDASAVTNNRTGIASPGFSCAIMAVRSGSGNVIQYGYEGITYAVRTGAKVISCSWGGYGGNDWTAQTVMAALQNDVLVVCAAGNDNTNRLHYPSGYDAVIAVAATDRNDRKAGFSNYGDWVDVSAPGVGILSTTPNNGYQAWDGTSMACPIAAGIVVLLRSTYPNRDARTIRQMLYDGADEIDQGQTPIGSGRVNARRSLELGNQPLLAVDTLQIINDDNNNGQFDPGENLDLSISVSNARNGQPAEELVAVITSDDPEISFEVDSLSLPDLGPGDVIDNSDNPFVVNISDESMAHTTWITVTVNANPGGVIVHKKFEVVIGHPPILVVDDDEGMDFENYYLPSIEEGGRGWVRWNVATRYSPDASTLSDYDMVIWETGDALPPLDDLDRYQIEGAVSEGANILLIGNRIGDDPDNRDLLRTWFGARHEQDSVSAYTIEGLAGNRPLDRGVRMFLTGEGGAGMGRISPSTMSPALGADSLAVYYVGPNSFGLAGVYRDLPVYHSKTAYLGFSFESVTDARTPRSEAISKMYDWFTGNVNSVNPGNSNLPGLVTLEQAYPNPFNGLVNLRYSVPTGSEFVLGIFDQSGRQVSILATGIGKTNYQMAAWNAAAFPSGVYWARLGVTGNNTIDQRLVLVK